MDREELEERAAEWGLSPMERARLAADHAVAGMAGFRFGAAAFRYAEMFAWMGCAIGVDAVKRAARLALRS